MKKLTAFLLAVIMVAGLSLTVTAASASAEPQHAEYTAPRNRHSSFVPTVYNITNEVLAGAYGDYMGDAAWFPEDTRAGSIVEIPLLKQGFLDEAGGEIEGWSDVDPTWGPDVFQLKANRIKAQIHYAQGKDYIKSINIVPMTPEPRNPAQAKIRIEFVDEFVSTKEFMYEFSVYLSLDGRKTATSELFGGRISNEIYDVYKIDYLYIGDGQIAYAETGTQMNLRLGLGNGVFLHGDMYKGDKYYGFARLYGNERQDPITQAYRKSIDTVIDITSVDLKINGAYATFEKELSNPKFYVYNLAGDYIGRSNEQLPYSTRYYLSVDEIEIDPALSQHPIAQGDDAKVPTAVTRFLEGGRAGEAVEVAK